MPAVADNSSFVAAGDAFAAGRYGDALGLFRAAQAEGVDSAALRYNIGVCLYRLGEYADAERVFAELAARYPGFRALAQYNRGLALLALERTDDAAVAFTVARTTGDERLAPLASAALAELEARRAVEPAPSPSLWSGYADFRAGHDDNVALLDELAALPGASTSSSFVEAFGYATRRIPSRVPVRLDFSGYVVRYPDAGEFDQDSWRAGAAFEWRAGDWCLAAGPQLLYSTLDGDGFERATGIVLQAVHDVGAHAQFDARLLFDDVAGAAPRFDYLDGRRERARFGFEHRDVGGGRLRVTYDIESQDRAEPNVSPERNRVALSYAHRVGERWSVEGWVAARTSRYEALVVERTERLREMTLGARRELSSGWFVNAEYRSADNAASVAQYDYRSRRVGFGLSRSF
jgi:tetratricopeptide (TPR) repeat protein